MSGLETAILIISFLLVASMFAYTVLAAGLVPNGGGQTEAVTAYSQGPETSEHRGSVLAYKGTVNSDDCISKISFTLSSMLADGQTIDLTPPYLLNSDGALVRSTTEPAMLISYNDANTIISQCAWTVEFSAGYQDDGDYLLEDGEKATITVWLHDYDPATRTWCNGSGDQDPFIDRDSAHLGPNDVFTVQLIPQTGPTLLMEKRIPAYLSPVMRLN